MPQHQILGLVLMVVAVVDTTVGNLLVVPRVSDPAKKGMMRFAFGLSGVLIAAVGLALYKGAISLGTPLR